MKKGTKTTKKNDMVSIDKILDYVKTDDTSIFTITSPDDSGELIEVTVKNSLSLEELTSFVRDIADYCFNITADDEESYEPEWYMFAAEYNVVKYFTNIGIPADLRKAYDFLTKTKIADSIYDFFKANDNNFLQFALDSAKKSIEYHKQEILSHNKSDELYEALIEIVQEVRAGIKDIKVDEIINKIDLSQIAKELPLKETEEEK